MTLREMPANLALVLLFGFVQHVPLLAQTEAKTAGAQGTTSQSKGQSSVQVVKINDKSVLSVKTPWQEQSKPRLQVTLLYDAESADIDTRSPIKFKNPEIILQLAQLTGSLNSSLGVDKSSMQIESSSGSFDIISFKNSLGNNGTMMAGGLLGAPPAGQIGAALAIFDLAPWVSSKLTGELRVDLPNPYFSKPGKIRAWLLSDENVVWSVTKVWPGNSK